MFCKNCGLEMNPEQDVCLNCGFGKGKGHHYCQHCGVEVKEEQELCVSCGNRLNTVVYKSGKSKLVAGILQIFLGGLGIGRFYLGYNQMAILQIVVTIVTCGLGQIWGIIDGIMILCGKVTDVDGKPLDE